MINEYLNNKVKFTVLSSGQYSRINEKGILKSMGDIMRDHYDAKYDIENKDKCPAAFSHDLGYQESVANIDNIINHYNGTAIIDIDSPKGKNGNKIWSHEYTSMLWNQLHSILLANKLYVYSELSFSGKGIHIIFNFKQDEWTKEKYHRFVAYCCNQVVDALIKLNFTEEQCITLEYQIPKIKAPCILDGHSFELVRKYYYKSGKILQNVTYNENAEWEYVNKYKAIDGSYKYHAFNVKDDEIISDTKYKITLDKKDKIIIPNEILTDEHNNRLKLCATVLKIFINNAGYDNVNVRHKALDYVTYIAECIWKDQVSDQRFKYDMADIRKKILSTLRNNFYINSDILDILKKYFEFTEYDPNIFYLNKSQYLSDVIEDIPFETGFNLLISGTGTGKTECWKKLTKFDLLNPGGHKIIVCEPYNSIIESKYDSNDALKACGSVVINKNFYDNLTVSNYNKIIKLEPEDCKNIDCIVIDESHLLFAEEYRSGITIKFIDKLKELSYYTKIILQTATPAFEQQIFNIDSKHIFTIKKDSNTKVTIEYKNSIGNKHLLWNAWYLAHHYLDNNICDRVFIYNGSGGYKDAYELSDEEYQNKYKTGIYHKKNPDRECIQYIDTHHKMGEYKILITSCWFGVGHDLHDDDRCLVIVCGNNPVHEEVQCVGRFRDAKQIHCIIMCDNYNLHDNEYKSQCVLRDIMNKKSMNDQFNSWTIRNGNRSTTTINIKTDEDIWYAWYVWKYKFMFNNLNYKMNMYNQLGWTIFKPIYNITKETIEDLKSCKCKLKEALGIIYNETYNNDRQITEILRKTGEYQRNTDNHKKGEPKYRKIGQIEYNDKTDKCFIYNIFNNKKKIDWYKQQELKIKKENIQFAFITKLLNNSFVDNDWSMINNEMPILEDWAKTVYGMYKHNNSLFRYCAVSGLLLDVHWYKSCIKYINLTKKENYDIIEWEIVKFMLENDKVDADYEHMIKHDIPCSFDIVSLYCIYCLYGNKNGKRIKGSYFDAFINLFKMTHSIHNDQNIKQWFYDKIGDVTNDNLVDFIMSNGKINYNDDVKLFRSHMYTLNEVQNMYKNIYKELTIINGDSKITLSKMNKAISKHMKNSNDKQKIGGKIGGKIGKRVRVVKDMPKYNLEIGDVYSSCSELAKIINIRNETITRWIKSGKLEQL